MEDKLVSLLSLILTFVGLTLYRNRKKIEIIGNGPISKILGHVYIEKGYDIKIYSKEIPVEYIYSLDNFKIKLPLIPINNNLIFTKASSTEIKELSEKYKISENKLESIQNYLIDKSQLIKSSDICEEILNLKKEYYFLDLSQFKVDNKYICYNNVPQKQDNVIRISTEIINSIDFDNYEIYIGEGYREYINLEREIFFSGTEVDDVRLELYSTASKLYLKIRSFNSDNLDYYRKKYDVNEYFNECSGGNANIKIKNDEYFIDLPVSPKSFEPFRNIVYLSFLLPHIII